MESGLKNWEQEVIPEIFLVINMVFEPTCAYARWAHMHHFPSVVCLPLEKNSYLWKYWGYRFCSVHLREKKSHCLLGVKIVVGGLISTSSCIFWPTDWLPHKPFIFWSSEPPSPLCYPKYDLLTNWLAIPQTIHVLKVRTPSPAMLLLRPALGSVLMGSAVNHDHWDGGKGWGLVDCSRF